MNDHLKACPKLVMEGVEPSEYGRERRAAQHLAIGALNLAEYKVDEDPTLRGLTTHDGTCRLCNLLIGKNQLDITSYDTSGVLDTAIAMDTRMFNNKYAN